MTAPTNIRTTLNISMDVEGTTHTYGGTIELKPLNPVAHPKVINNFNEFKDAMITIVNTLTTNDATLSQTNLNDINNISKDWVIDKGDNKTKIKNFINLFTLKTKKEDALRMINSYTTLSLEGGKGPQKGSSSKITRRRKSKGKKRAGTRHHKKGKR